jgi:Tfp pilus assembly protein PilF
VLEFQNVLFADTLAEMLHTEKKYRAAESLYLWSIKAFPAKADIYVNYAALLIDTNRPAEAKQYLDQAKSLTMTRNKRCEWLNNMGTACDHLRQKQCARDSLHQAAQDCPDNPVFQKNLEIVQKTRL